MRNSQLSRILTAALVAAFALGACVGAAAQEKRVKRAKVKSAKVKRAKAAAAPVRVFVVVPQVTVDTPAPNPPAAGGESVTSDSPVSEGGGGKVEVVDRGIAPRRADDVPAPNPPATAGQLVISEFRVRGPNGANYEFIEIYNSSGADHTVTPLSGTGYGVAASDGITRCSIPNGTVIPNRGHFLCVNTVGYSLAAYPAGNGLIATGDANYTINIPDNAGIALFNNNTGGASYSFANRLDAVGSTAEGNTLYKEGTGYPALTPFSIDYSFSRDMCGKSGSITTFGPCPIEGLPKDTDNNAADFVFVDSNGTSAGAGQRLGVAGPENLSSPIMRNSSFSVGSLDPCVGTTSSPNRARDLTSDLANNSLFGTLDIRKTIVNNTGGNVSRLRFRIIDLTTFPAPSGIADLRPRTSTATVVMVDRAPCGAGVSNVTVQGTTLEQPPSQPNGGGFNSTLSAGTVTLATPLSPTDNPATPGVVENAIDVRFLLGVMQLGSFRFYVNIEALP